MSFDYIKDWTTQKEQVCSEIMNRRLPLKILLKTKDDPEMLGPWIEHHRRIVGLEGIIIFDNMSSDQKVESIYEKFFPEIQVFRYSTFHNLIHHTHYFSELYSALRASCHHFAFLDTDERISLFDGLGRFHFDTTITGFLTEQKETFIFPGTWLQNISGYTNLFSLSDTSAALQNGLKWGKPVLSTACAFDGMINHNTQVDHSLYKNCPKTNLFVLHLSRVSIEQRINANLKKLRVYKAISKDCTLAEFLLLEVESLVPNQAQMYAKEIHGLVLSRAEKPGPPTNWIKVSDDGLVTFSSDWQKRTLENFIASPMDYSSELFSQS